MCLVPLRWHGLGNAEHQERHGAQCRLGLITDSRLPGVALLRIVLALFFVAREYAQRLRVLRQRGAAANSPMLKHRTNKHRFKGRESRGWIFGKRGGMGHEGTLRAEETGGVTTV